MIIIKRNNWLTYGGVPGMSNNGALSNPTVGKTIFPIRMAMGCTNSWAIILVNFGVVSALSLNLFITNSTVITFGCLGFYFLECRGDPPIGVEKSGGSQLDVGSRQAT